MKYLNCVLLGILGVAQIAVAGGSAGTTGGGNLPEWMQMLPSRLEIYEVSRVVADAYDREECFTGNSRAWRGQNRASFYEQYFVFDSQRWPAQNTVEVASTRMRRGLRESIGESSVPARCKGERVRVKINADGRDISVTDFVARLTAVKNFTVSQVDLQNLDTWKAVVEYNELFSSLLKTLEGTTGIEAIELSADLITDRVTSEVNQMHDAIMTTARASVTAEGQCVFEQFAQMRALMRAHWTMPNSLLNPASYQRLSAIGYGTQERTLAHDFSPLVTLVNSKRTETFELLASTVYPACDAFSNSSELRFDAPVAAQARETQNGGTQ